MARCRQVCLSAGSHACAEHPLPCAARHVATATASRRNRLVLSDEGCAGGSFGLAERWKMCRSLFRLHRVMEGVPDPLWASPSDGGCAVPPSASPSDGGCAEGSFGLTALEGWGRGAFPQPWVGGMQPLRPSARQLPDPKLPPLPHRRAAGVAEGIAPEDPGDGSPTRADLDTTRVPGDTGPCHPSGAPSPDHGRLCQDWDTVGYEDHGTGDGSGVGGLAPITSGVMAVGSCPCWLQPPTQAS